MALICETVMTADVGEMRRLRDASIADMVEVRLDGLTTPDVAAALEGRRVPVLLTCRAAWEGGHFQGSEDDRLRILNQALASDAEYVDVEWRADRRALAVRHQDRLVLSHHDFSGTPTDAGQRFDAMRAENPHGVVKLACATASPGDVGKLLDIGRSGRGAHVVIGLGGAGQISRVCPRVFGSRWTYGGSAAPGQLPVAQLAGRYRVASQSSSTLIFAVVGSPIAHSASPAMHNAAFDALGIDAVYAAIEADDAGAVLALATAIGLTGLSVTAPLKREWAAHGVENDDRTRRVGAANTLLHSGNRWTATNFDIEGFLAPLLDRPLPVRGRRCVVLGAGGAARAAAWALRSEGGRVEISARRPAEAARLAGELGVDATAWPPAPGWDLLVNATPVGTAPNVAESPIPRASVEGAAVYDLVYHPRQTQLMKWAADAGAQTVEGLDMLVAQAALQFEHWTGQSAPRDIMRRAAEEFLAGDDRNFRRPGL